MSFLDGLNENQLQAVMHQEGSAMIIAGAGSGKTRVLTYRIAYLVNKGIDPYNILALTFTNKAAKEMKERIESHIEHIGKTIWMGTFHSIFSKLLRAEAKYLNFSPNFTIYDSNDTKGVIKSIIKELELDDKLYKPNIIASKISAAKNSLILPEYYANDSSLRKKDYNQGIDQFWLIYETYVKQCKQADVMDFDDLLLQTYLLLQNNDEIRLRYATRFEHILVDEYQDTNYAQHQIIKLLSSVHQQVYVVGDDAQSIYSFRGANIENILYFQKQFQGAKLYKLEQNYRSSQNIVGAANSIIVHNKSQIPKEVFSCNSPGDLIEVVEAPSDLDEADYVVSTLRKWNIKEHIPYEHLAVLYRTNAQSRVLEEKLLRYGIPYRVYGGLSFYQRKEVKDVLAYFRVVVNPNDEEALKRIINYPHRGIGLTTLHKIIAQARKEELSVWQILQQIATDNNFKSRATAKIQNFVYMIESFITQKEILTASALGEKIIQECGILNELMSENTLENRNKKENVLEIINAIAIFEKDWQKSTNEEKVFLAQYLTQVSLLSDLDVEEDNQSKINLMTVHASKGLEFEGVCIVGLERDLFPTSSATLSNKEMEEERRLFYVAVTRAKHFCKLFYALTRFQYGSKKEQERSPFLNEIAEEFVIDKRRQQQKIRNSNFNAFDSLSKEVYTTKPKPRKYSLETALQIQKTMPQNGTLPIKEGSIIKHERFGKGVVKALENMGGSMKATIDFETAGTKGIFLAFAKYTIVE